MDRAGRMTGLPCDEELWLFGNAEISVAHIGKDTVRGARDPDLEV
jgi:hypothetical protein